MRNEAEAIQESCPESGAGQVRIGVDGLLRGLQSGHRQQAFGQPRQIPAYRARLAAKGVEPGLIKISGGEAGVPDRRKAPWTIVEALPGDIYVVRIEHPMDEAGRHIGARQTGDARRHRFEQGRRPSFRGLRHEFGEIIVNCIAEQSLDRGGVFEISKALEGADADMRVGKPQEHTGARGRRLVAANQFFPGFDQAEALGCVDAHGFQHLRREDFTNAALEREPSVAAPRPGRPAASLCPKVKQAPIPGVSQLCEKKPPAIAKVWIIGAELMPVIAQRQRLWECAGQRLEAAEMSNPFVVAERVEAHARRPSLVSKAQNVVGEARRGHFVKKALAKRRVQGFGLVAGGNWH